MASMKIPALSLKKALVFSAWLGAGMSPFCQDTARVSASLAKRGSFVLT